MEWKKSALMTVTLQFLIRATIQGQGLKRILAVETLHFFYNQKYDCDITVKSGEY